MQEKIITLSEYKPHPQNYNEHPETQLTELEKSLEQFGQPKNIVVWRGYFIAGHGLATAAQRKGLKTLKAVDVSEWDEQKAIDFLIADNETARMAIRNDEILGELLKSRGDVINTVPGVSSELLRELLQDLSGSEKPKETEPPRVDKAGELQAVWGVKTGDIWELSANGLVHRVVCGDCTDEGIIGELMGGDKAEVLFTSPPYKDARDYGGHDMSINKIKRFISVFAPYVNFQCVNLGILFRDNEVIQYWDEYIQYAKQSGLKLLAWNVWDKEQSGSIASATAMFMLTHEWIFVFGDTKKRLNRTIENNIEAYKKRHGDDVINSGTYKMVRQKDGNFLPTTSIAYTHHQLHSVSRIKPELARNMTDCHPAVMRIDVPIQYIEAMTNERDLICEPYLGSGTTLIASHQTNRQCRAVEIEPKYVAVTLQRFQDLTGQAPKLIKNIAK